MGQDHVSITRTNGHDDESIKKGKEFNVFSVMMNKVDGQLEVEGKKGIVDGQQVMENCY